MADWLKSMQQSFEYYVVDPATWRDSKKLTNVKSCTISRDSSAETLGSATFDVTESVGECYIRVYMITNQNGVTEKHPLGTFLAQTPSSEFDGMVRTVSMDAYTPLLELKENPPPLGYSIFEDKNIMDEAYRLTRDNLRAPVVKPSSDETLKYNFVSNVSDTWLTFVTDLISNAKYDFGLDELGRVIFLPRQKIETLQPIWTFDDGNSSILEPPVTMDHDLFDIPNVVEVLYGNNLYSRVVNDDPNSPTSTVRRGRYKTHRVTDVSDIGVPTQKQLDEYAKNLLKTLSEVEYTLTYSHGYCPVRLGDCVRLNYERAGLTNIKAKVINQEITCRPGCIVNEKAVFTAKLWG